MPALLPVNHVLKITCRGSSASKVIENIFHVAYVAVSSSTAAANNYAAAFAAVYEPRIWSYAHTSFTLTDVFVDDLSPGPAISGHATRAYAGSTTGNCAPYAISPCWTWHDAAPRYRGGKPKTFLPPIGENGIDAPNNIHGATLTNMRADAAGFITDVDALLYNAAASALVIVHRNRGRNRLTPPEADAVFSATVNPVLKSQRRRMAL